MFGIFGIAEAGLSHALVMVQHLAAVWAGVLHILTGVHTEWNTGAGPAPERDMFNDHLRDLTTGMI